MRFKYENMIWSWRAKRSNPVVRQSYNVFAGFVCVLVVIGVACKNPVDAPTVLPTLTSIQQNIFNKSCTTSSCHSTFGNGGGLVLESGKAYSYLINATPTSDGALSRHLVRVNPGKPDSSFLLIKLTGPLPDEGVQMPNKGGSLSAEQINAVRQWIADGAKND